MLRQQNAEIMALPRLRKMARLHEERAWELLSAGDPDGWIDLLAAVTAWGSAGMKLEAGQLIANGRQLVDAFPDGKSNLERQLDDINAWLDGLASAPAPVDFESPLPRHP